MTTWRLAPPIVAYELKLRLTCASRHSKVVPHQVRSARAGRKVNAIEMTGREMSSKQDQCIQFRTMHSQRNLTMSYVVKS
jgi:hypothetical protein